MIAIKLDSDTEELLDRLVEKTGRSKTHFAGAAILEYIEEFEDIHLAKSRVEEKAASYSAEEVKPELGL